MGDPRVRRALGVARRLSPSIFPPSGRSSPAIVKASSGTSTLRFPLRERRVLLYTLRLGSENQGAYIIITARPRRTLPEIKRTKTRRGLHLDNRPFEAASNFSSPAARAVLGSAPATVHIMRGALDSRGSRKRARLPAFGARWSGATALAPCNRPARREPLPA